MLLSTMRFAGYSWRHNPLSMNLLHELFVTSTVTPAQGEQIDNVSKRISHVYGKGELVGEDCIEQYRALEKLFAKGQKGVLTLPGMPSFKAYFTKLEVEGQPTPDVLEYSFEFTKAQDSVDLTQYHRICKEGETLFDIAYDFSTTVDELVRLNPHIKRPDAVKAGERVRIC